MGRLWTRGIYLRVLEGKVREIACEQPEEHKTKHSTYNIHLYLRRVVVGHLHRFADIL